MYRSKARFFQLICMLFSIALLVSLCGCTHHRIRPGLETETESDTAKPVGAETEDSTPKKRVAITFDDGPNHYDDRTKKYVDELDKYGFHATFFVVGNRVEGGNALAYAVEHGNEIGIHGYTHNVYYDECDDERYDYEINETVLEIQGAIPGYEPTLMRPVGGKITHERANASPYSIILWSIDSSDWENRYYPGIPDEEADEKVQTIVRNVINSVEDGDIILLHDIYESTYDATVIILKQLYEMGYEVVTVSELLGDTLMPGIIYSSAND